MKKIGSLYVPSGFHSVHIKKEKETNFSEFLVNIGKSNPTTGVNMAKRLVAKIMNTVEESFEKNRAPMRNRTEAEVQRRIDICIEFCLSSSERSASVLRVIDEIPQHLWEALQISDKMKNRLRSWGVSEKISREDFEAMREDKENENTESF